MVKVSKTPLSYNYFIKTPYLDITIVTTAIKWYDGNAYMYYQYINASKRAFCRGV